MVRVAADSFKISRRARTLPGSRAQRAAAVRLLVLSLTEGRLDADAARALVARASVPVVLETARYHRVGGLVCERLQSAGIPDLLIEGLRQIQASALSRHMGIVWSLNRVSRVLDASDVAWAVVKGPVLAERLYGGGGRRSYTDLDILVEPTGLRVILSRLEAAGAELLDRNWAVIRRELFGELHLRLDGGALLDLHWSLVTIYRGRTSVSTTELLGRRQRVDVMGVPAWSLDRNDELIHLAIHATFSGGDRLVWMKDIDLAARQGIDWEIVVERSRAWKVGAAVGLMLARTAQTLETPVPNGLAATLLGPFYLRVMAGVDRLSPWWDAFGRVTTPGLLVSRSLGQGPLGAAGWLVRRSLRNLDPREPALSSAFTPRGTTADREAFFEAAIAAEDRARIASRSSDRSLLG